jgi:chemotaxis protein methyltransferase WspC
MLIKKLQDAIQRVSGLEVSELSLNRAVTERMRISSICASNDVLGIDDYLSITANNESELNALIELLVTPETWFFRDPAAFNAASKFAQALFTKLERPINLLSIPCASGEEPYSLAMSLLDIGMEHAQFTVHAMDISSAGLARAAQGIYRQNAFRNEDRRFQRKYFIDEDQGALLDPKVRALVQFSQNNLLTIDTEAFKSRFDIIFCRNLLIYFDEPTQVRAVKILEQLLHPEGRLFVGYAEMPVFISNGFQSVQLPLAFALRKHAEANDNVAASPKIHSASPKSQRPPKNVALTTLPKPVPQSVATQSLVIQSRLSKNDNAVVVETALQFKIAELLNRARSLADRGELDVAVLDLEACLKIAPDTIEAYAMLGVIYAAQNNFQSAQQYFRKALYLDANQYDVICHLALVCEKQGDTAAAEILRSRAARVAQRESPRDGPGTRSKASGKSP